MERPQPRTIICSFCSGSGTVVKLCTSKLGKQFSSKRKCEYCKGTGQMDCASIAARARLMQGALKRLAPLIFAEAITGLDTAIARLEE